MKKITLNNGLSLRSEEVSVKSLLTFIYLKNEPSEPQMFDGERGIHWSSIPNELLAGVQSGIVNEYRTEGEQIKVTLYTKDITSIDEVL